jgi:hypothetical protein
MKIIMNLNLARTRTKQEPTTQHREAKIAAVIKMIQSVVSELETLK